MISNSFLPITEDTNNLMEVTKCALATCHSVGSLEGKLVGNEVEVRMFEATGWELLEREGAQPSVKSPLETRSYERMQQLSKPDSVPSEYKDVADTLAKKDVCTGIVVSRATDGRELSLLGLILFRNELKEDTSDAIKLLKKGDIRVVMITGDNAMCGCYIARNSGMVSPNSRVILADIERTGSGVNTRLGEVEWRTWIVE
ncbi:HAD-like domain [Phytophthora cactorum]|nr:HAD-like domain [Phytophthora cactorum]